MSVIPKSMLISKGQIEITNKPRDTEGVRSGRFSYAKTLKPDSTMARVAVGNNLRQVNVVVCPYSGYNSFAVEKNDLRTFPLYPFGDQIEIYGKVTDGSGNFPIENCLLEVWHLSPNSSLYNHRAKFRTNELGQYRFITDQPGRKMGENYKIFYKITYKEQSYFSKLTFNNIQAFMGRINVRQNSSMGKKETLAKKKTSVNKSTLEFNLLLQ